MNRLLLAVVIAALGLSACSQKEEAAAPAAPAPKAEAPAAPPQPPAQQAASYPPNTGKLVQVLQAGGYTYGEVEGPAGQRVWIAGGHIDAKPGDMVQWGRYALMRNFNAKSIDRTFDTILFVTTWGPVGGTATAVAEHGSMPEAQNGANPHAGGAPGAAAPAAGAAPGRTGVVKSVTTAGGYTYLEVQQGDATIWIAAPETKIEVGQTVSWSGGMVMRNFTAKSLDRTFEQIVFAGGVSPVQ